MCIRSGYSKKVYHIKYHVVTLIIEYLSLIRLFESDTLILENRRGDAAAAGYL